LNRDKLQQHLIYRKIAELLFWLPALGLLYWSSFSQQCFQKE
jgi:hypothetical protein